MVFGAGFASMMTNARQGNGGRSTSGAAAETTITQTQGDPDDEDGQPELVVDPARLQRGDTTRAEGLGISRDDWLQVGDVAQTLGIATPATLAGTPTQDRLGTGGQLGVETPQAPRGDGGSQPQAASAREVLAKRSLTAEEIKREFEWQQGAGATPTTVKTFKEAVGDSPPFLVVFGFMMEGSPFLNALHSVSRFSYFAAGDHINNKYYAFLGDRTEDDEPYPIQLQPNNAWNWEEVEVCVDPQEASSWYSAHGNQDVCWFPGDLATKVRMKIPRMLLLPTVLAKFVLSKDKCTPFQLYEESKRLMLNGVLDESLLDLVTEWCIAVGQTKNVTTVSPALTMEYLPAPVRDPHFGPWKNMLLKATIGPRPRGGGSRPGGATPPSHSGGAGNAPDPLTASMLQMAQSMQVLAKEVVNSTKAASSGSSNSGAKAETNVMTTYMLATLMGWSHIEKEEQVEPIWPRLINTKHMDETRLVLMRRMLEIAESRKPPLKFDKRVYYTDKQLKAIMEMKPNSGDGTPTFGSLGKALTIMANMPRSAALVEEIRTREKADRETLGTRTYSEAIQIEAGEKTLPPDTLEGLTKLISMFTLETLALYGESCDFAKRLLEIYYLLEEDDLKSEGHRFTAQYCKEVILIWAIHVDKCSYFGHRLMPEDFAGGATPRFKKSLLWDVIHKLQFTNPIDRGTFPPEWKLIMHPPTFPPSIYNPAPTGSPPTFKPTTGGDANTQQPRTLVEKLAHVHDYIKECLQPFHVKFNGRMMVIKMLTMGGRKWEDLPPLEGFVDTKTSKNTLCYNHVLGYCSGKKCRFKHPRKDQVTDTFAREVCRVVGDGAKWLVLNETSAPGGGTDKPGGKRDEPPEGGSSPSKRGKDGGRA
jgi:hypothetical protein